MTAFLSAFWAELTPLAGLFAVLALLVVFAIIERIEGRR